MAPATSIDSITTLNNGAAMPCLGLGVWQSKSGKETENAVSWAIEVGYRHIDTASIYGNEKSVGEGLRQSGIPRNSVFITSKLWNSDQGANTTRAALLKSLDNLGLNYLDLYLVHWPKGHRSVESWQVLEECQREGLVKTLGLSNFLIPHLNEFLSHCTIQPAVNQIEFHPYLSSPKVVAYCREKQIQVQAWSPIMQGRVVDVPVLVDVAEKYHKSPAQIALRWALQKDVIVIPKSAQRQRIQENAALFDFALDTEDMRVIDELNRDQRFGPDPLNFNF